MPQNEVEKFFDSLPSQDKKIPDTFEQKVNESTFTEKVNEKNNDGEEVEGRKNRAYRRLEEKYQRERESAIALNERLIALAEAREENVNRNYGDNLDPDLIRVFGDSDTGKEVARIFDKKLTETATRAREEALIELEQRQSQGIQEQKEYESLIDSQLESLEDEHNIDLTSNAPQARKARREFLEMVQNLSPKDENGAITGYADFDSVFDVYERTRSQDKSPEMVSRQKEIASRSMQRSGAVDNTKLNDDANLNYLRSIGIRI